MDSYYVQLAALLVHDYGLIENAGGFILQEVRKLLCLNKSLTHLMAGLKVSVKK